MVAGPLHEQDKTAILLACCALLAGCDPRTNEAHKAVADMLIDPASAQFRNDAYNSKTETTCGEVNAKNRMGGYIGFSPYVHMNLGVTYISSGPPDFEEYFRDSRPYSEYTTRRAIDKLFDACFLWSEQPSFALRTSLIAPKPT